MLNQSAGAGACNTPHFSSPLRQPATAGITAQEVPPRRQSATGGIDWWSGVVTVGDRRDVKRLMQWLSRKWAGHCNLYWTESKSKFRGKPYRQIFQTPLGIEVAHDEDDTGKTEVRCEIKGQALGYLTHAESVMIVAEMALKWNFKCTRLDIKCDLKGMRGMGLMQKVSDAALSGSYTKFQKSSEIKTHTRDGKLDGWTIYFGSPKSTSKVRWYHKGLERGDGSDWVRCEVQYRSKSAEHMVQQILKHCPNWHPDCVSEPASKLLMSIALSATEFRERDAEKTGHYCIDQLPKLDWYAYLLAWVDVTPARFEKMKPENTNLARTVRWLRKQVFGVLSVVDLIKGASWLSAELDERLTRPSDDTQARLSTWLLELGAVGALASA